MQEGCFFLVPQFPEIKLVSVTGLDAGNLDARRLAIFRQSHALHNRGRLIDFGSAISAVINMGEGRQAVMFRIDSGTAIKELGESN